MKRSKWLAKVALLVLVIALTGAFGFGCVSGLQPVGWSGGVFNGDTLLTGSAQGRLVSVNLTAERPAWSEAIQAKPQGGFFGGCDSFISPGGGCSGGSSGVAIYGTPVVEGNKAYLAGYNGKVYSFDITSGSPQFDDDYPALDKYLDPIVGGLAVADGIVYFGCSDGTLYALNADNLIEKWTFETGDKVWATPVVSDGVLYFGSFDKKLYALDAASGQKLWEFATEGSIITEVVVDDDTVYFGSFDRNFYALNKADGSLKWQNPADNWFWAKPLLHEGVIYAPDMTGVLHIYDAATGGQLASLGLKISVASAPAVYEDSVIVANRDGAIYSVSTLNYSMRELNDIEQDIYGPLAVRDGVIYVHTADLTLHRINAANGAVLRSISLEYAD